MFWVPAENSLLHSFGDCNVWCVLRMHPPWRFLLFYWVQVVHVRCWGTKSSSYSKVFRCLDAPGAHIKMSITSPSIGGYVDRYGFYSICHLWLDSPASGANLGAECPCPTSFGNPVEFQGAPTTHSKNSNPYSNIQPHQARNQEFVLLIHFWNHPTLASKRPGVRDLARPTSEPGRIAQVGLAEVAAFVQRLGCAAEIAVNCRTKA